MTDFRKEAQRLYHEFYSTSHDFTPMIESSLMRIWNECCDEMKANLAEYRKAYDESLFPPRDMKQFDETARTATAGYMGRFVLDNCIKDVEKLKRKEGE